MKTTAAILLAVLILLPITLRVTVFARLLKRANNNSGQPPDEPLSPTKLKFYTKLALIFIAFYMLIIFVVVLWVSSILLESAGFSTKAVVYTSIFTFVLFSFLGATIYLWTKYVYKINPRPPVGSENKIVNEWHNKYSDIVSKNLWLIIVTMIGGTLLLITLFGLIVYFTR